MNLVNLNADLQDPIVPNWGELELEETWADSIELGTISGFYQFIKLICGKRKPVKIPSTLYGAEAIPKYALQEFHNIPNGNFSRRLSRGYITGFDLSMLGFANIARRWIAERLKHCQSVADIGTAGGRTGQVIKDAGVAEVWGIDPCPYLLKHAASDHPTVKFVTGTAENLPFKDKRLDGISAVFLFHELPPKYVRIAFKSFNRVLKMGGKVVIAEPSVQQWEPFRLKEFLSTKGWLKIYFKALAKFVYEPFVHAWHSEDKKALFENAGFKLVEKENGMPISCYHLEKTRTL